MANNRQDRSKPAPKPPSFIDVYKEHVRTPAAVLLADGTLVVLALAIMACVLVALQAFLVLGASPVLVGFVETVDTYSMTSVIVIFCIDTPVKIVAFAMRGLKT